MKHEKNGTTILLNGKRIELKHEVKETIEYNGFLIARLSTKEMDDETSRRNILALNVEGQVVWHIEPMYYLDDAMPHLKETFREKIPIPYVGLRLADDGVRVTAQSDQIYLIDHKTGKHLKQVGQTH